MDELTRLVAARPGQVGRLAERWLAGGARAVQLWGRDGLAAAWDPGLSLGIRHAAAPRDPAGPSGPRARRQPVGLRADVAPDGGRIGWMRVIGPRGPVARRRLEADAAYVAALVDHEREITSLADALAESQDHLLGLAGLTVAGATEPGEAQALASIAGNLRALVGVPVAAAAVLGEAANLAIEPLAAEAAVQPVLDRLRARYAGARPTDGRLSVPTAGVEHIDGWLVASAPLDRNAAVVLMVGPGTADATSETVRLMEAAVEVAGTIVSRARRLAEVASRARLQRELELAADVQRHLVAAASVPVAGLDLATRYRSASEIGGDVLAVRAAGEATLAAVGDVSGKGIAAALLMASARTAFASAARTTSDPGVLLARIADELGDDLERTGRFITLCVVRIEPRIGRLEIANAGHSPVLLASGAAGPRLIPATEPPIGVAESPFTTVIRSFRPGDLLVIASDGITEREDPAERRFGSRRLSARIRSLRGAPSAAVADGILEAADRFAGDRDGRRDDETLVVVRRA